MFTRTLPAPAAAVATLALTAAGAAGCGVVPLGGAAAPAAVVIGVDLALTGPDSPLGTVYHDALRLRATQLNRSGLPGSRRLVLLVRDNRSDPQVAAANLAELAEAPNTAAIVSGACGSCAAQAAGRFEQHRVPVISLAADEQVATPVEQRRWLFKLGPNAADTAAVLADQLDRDAAGTVGLVTTEGDYGAAGRREMTDAAQRADFQIVTGAQLATDQTAAAAAAIAGWAPDPPVGFAPDPDPTGPDAVVIWAPQPVAGALAADLRTAGYSGGLYLDAVAAGDLYQPAGALSGARLVFTDTPVADQLIAATPAQAARQRWFRDYLAAYGTYHAQASWAADAAGLIAEAIRRADQAGQPPSREVIRDRLESTRRFDGLTGLIRYTADQHSGLHPGSLTTLTAAAGRWRPAG